jgi:hypothetical protein
MRALDPIRKKGAVGYLSDTRKVKSSEWKAYATGVRCRSWRDTQPTLLSQLPHGPALCVRRLGTLRGHRSLSCDLTLPHDITVHAASVWLLRRKL